MASATAPRGSPAKPVPSRASTRPRRLAGAPGQASGCRPCDAFQVRARVAAQIRRPSPTSCTSTSRPASRSSRAEPGRRRRCCPLPQTTTMRPPGATRPVTRARPARRAPSAPATGSPAPRSPSGRSRASARRPGAARARASAHQRSIATAPAVVRVWVSEIGRRRPPPRAAVQAHARRAAASLDLDVARAQHVQRQRLGHRLLGAEARGEVLRGPGARGRVGALGVGEQALGQPGAARARARGARSPGGRARRPLDGDGLGQVARLVDVQAALAGDRS